MAWNSAAVIANSGTGSLFLRSGLARTTEDLRMYAVIRLHPAAPAKPAVGEPCNGCGVCCASEPCPLGVVASLRTTGACDALVWRDDEHRYRCGLIAQPAAHLPRVLRRAAPALATLAHRFIAAGSGCDCSLDVVGTGDDESERPEGSGDTVTVEGKAPPNARTAAGR